MDTVLSAHIESLIFCSSSPISLDEIQDCLNELFETDIAVEEIKAIVESLSEKYEAEQYSFSIASVAGGYEFLTKPAHQASISILLKQKSKRRLSTSALETLAIIAYKQPLTRQELDDIRGVDSSGVIKTLLDKKVIAPAGRKKVAGRPIMYRTTQKFLEYFGLKDLSDLPTLEDLKEELEGDDPPLQAQIEFASREARSSESEVVDDEEDISPA